MFLTMVFGVHSPALGKFALLVSQDFEGLKFCIPLQLFLLLLLLQRKTDRLFSLKCGPGKGNLRLGGSYYTVYTTSIAQLSLDKYSPRLRSGRPV